ncbi:MAG: Xaa-Pro aminopeptidase, partial [Marivirga sp.]|nr:Xaa-Pro aminopeptidase [Marivirga sp.]
MSVAASGNIYFASYRDGNLDLFMSEFKDGKFSTPVNLGGMINSSAGEHDPFIAPDESFLIFNS